MIMKVAWFSPLPPEESAVAEYCGVLLPHLQPYMEIDLFVEDPGIHRGTDLAGKFPIFDYRSYRRKNGQVLYGINVYHMEEGLSPRYSYLSLVENPGLVVFHEPALLPSTPDTPSAGWLSEEYRCQPEPDRDIERDRAQSVAGYHGPEIERPAYRMLQRVVDSSLGIIVHSRQARHVVLEHHPRGPVEAVEMPYVPNPETEEGASKVSRAHAEGESPVRTGGRVRERGDQHYDPDVTARGYCEMARRIISVQREEMYRVSSGGEFAATARTRLIEGVVDGLAGMSVGDDRPDLLESISSAIDSITPP